MQLKETHMTHAEKNAFAPPRDRKDTAIVLEQLFQCFNLLQFHVHDSLYTFVMFFSFKYIVTLQLQLLVCLLHDLCALAKRDGERKKRRERKMERQIDNWGDNETERGRDKKTKKVYNVVMSGQCFLYLLLHCKCKLNDKMRMLVPNSSLRMSLSLSSSSVQVTLSCLRKTKHSNWLHTIFQSQICATGAV